MVQQLYTPFLRQAGADIGRGISRRRERSEQEERNKLIQQAYMEQPGALEQLYGVDPQAAQSIERQKRETEQSKLQSEQSQQDRIRKILLENKPLVDQTMKEVAKLDTLEEAQAHIDNVIKQNKELGITLPPLTPEGFDRAKQIYGEKETPKIEKGIDPETGKEVFTAITPEGAKPIPGVLPRPEQSAAEVKLNIEAEKSFNKEFGKINAEQFFEKRAKAEEALKSLEGTQEAVKLLNEGMITGTGAEFLVSFGKLAERFGFDTGNEIDNSQAFLASQAKQVASIITAFGAGTGLSDADREFAEKAAAAKITLSEDAIRRIIGINIRASRNVIENFNKQAEKLPQGITPFDMKLPMPEVSAEKPEDLTKLSDEELLRMYNQ